MPTNIIYRLIAVAALAGTGWLPAGAQGKPAPARVTISGTVISGETKGPMKGASITIAGTKKGATADEQGHFTIKLNKGQILEFNHVGFEKQQYKAARTDSITITMKLHVAENDEVVVIGYGSVKNHILPAPWASSKMIT